MVHLKKWVLSLLPAVLIIAIGAGTAVCATSTMRIVQAYQGVKILYNGQELTGSVQPYIINNTTYVPLRLLMNKFGKNITWDAANYQVVITDSTTETSLQTQLTQKNAQITELQNKNTELQNTINTLNAKINSLQSATSISDIKSTLNNYFEDAGDDYFGDDGIDVTISLSGDEDDLYYTIKMDFDDADDYDHLNDLSQTKIKSFLNAVKSKIVSVTNDTDYEDADITGKLIDNDNSSYYVTYNGSSYTFSWSS